MFADAKITLLKLFDCCWLMIVFSLLIIDDIVVVVIYVFSFLGYKIPCMYINRIHYVFFSLIVISLLKIPFIEKSLSKINQSIQGLQQK